MLRRFPTRRLFVVTPFVLIATGAGLVGARARVPENEIAPGVQVGNLKLGGKSIEEARTLLQSWVEARQALPVTLHFNADSRITKQWTPDAHKLGLGLDVNATLDEAAKAGREGLLSQVSHMFTGSKTIVVPAHPTVDAAQLRAYLKQIAYKVNCKPRNARLKLNGTTIAAYLHDRSGLGMDVSGSADAVAQAWTRFNANAAPAPAPATGDIPSPIPSNSDTTPPTAVDPNVHQKPQEQGTGERQGDRETGRQGGGESSDTQHQVTDSPAETLDVELLAKATPAAITYEDIKQINGVLGSKETDIGGTANRHSNVALAASRINGTVLRPGEVFSYNKTVGHRDIESGFKEAPEIVKGVLKPGVGGGVCQVSTTLFNSVLKSNLKIVDRSHHAFPVHYVHPGLDATVVDGDIDFRFQNNTDAPVYIYGAGRGGTLTFRIYGKTMQGRTVELVRGKQTSSDYGTETETDSSLPAGHREIKVPGHPRIDVTWYRVVKDNGVEVGREPISTHYRAIPQVVIVGTRLRPTAPRAADKGTAPAVNTAPAANSAPAADDGATPQLNQ
jgi:vancomycin resistance protein YoaR